MHNKIKANLLAHSSWAFVSLNRSKLFLIILISGPGSSVGIATAYGLDGPGIESRWSEIFRTSPDRP